MRKSYCVLAIFLLLLLAGCIAISRNPPQEALPPEQATGTALVSLKYTQAAELTSHPATPVSTEPPVGATIVWTPGPDEVVASDSGKTFNIGMTERISVILDERQYPPSELKQQCVPEGVLGTISNIPVVPPGLYVIRYEGVQPGQCTIRNGTFEVTINVINRP